MTTTHNKFTHYVIERLEHWAQWYSSGNYLGLGYPSCSIEYRLMTEGIVVRGAKIKTVSCNEAAEEIESLVCEMAKLHRTQAWVLRIHYFTTGSLRHKTEKLNQLNIKISYSHYKHRVDLAHQWLEGRLSAMPRRTIFF